MRRGGKTARGGGRSECPRHLWWGAGRAVIVPERCVGGLFSAQRYGWAALLPAMLVAHYSVRPVLTHGGTGKGTGLLCGPSLKSVSLMTFLCCPYPPGNQAHPSLTHLTGGATHVLFLALVNVPPFNARWLPVVTWLLIWFILTKPVYFGACQQSPRRCEEHMCGCVSMLLCIVPSLKKEKKRKNDFFFLDQVQLREALKPDFNVAATL